MLTRRALLASTAGLAATSVPLVRGRAQGSPVLKLGVLNDQSGPYRGNGGPGSVACVKQAVQEFASQHGLNVEVISADHQGKPDIGLGIARQWFDQGVDVAMDFQNSAIALAVAGLAREKDKIALPCNAGTAELTGKQCSPNTIHWAYDTYMLARTVGGATVKTGGDTWFFITADYAFGHALESSTTNFIKKAGGRVLGDINMPFPSNDFSSALLRAQMSGAKVIGFANAGTDTVNCIKQAAEFGISQHNTKMAALLLMINDVHALGLNTAHGLLLANVFYWDLNDRTRAFAKRVQTSVGAMPTMSQAACYGAALHYMKAAAEMGVADIKKSGRAAVARMKAMPVDDEPFGRCRIRDDGRVLHTAYLFEVKKPDESTKPWDYYKLVATVPPDEAWRPLADGGCPFVRT